GPVGSRLAIITFSRADLLLGNGLDLEQFLRQPQGPVTPLHIGDRLRIVRLGLTEVGTLDRKEGVACLDDVARPGQHLNHAAGDRRVDAGDRFLVELYFAARLEDALAYPHLRGRGLDRRLGAIRGLRLGRRFWCRGGRRRGALTAAGGERCDGEQDRDPPPSHHFSTEAPTAASS